MITMMMMKVAGIFALLIAATSAAPALVWKDLEPVSATTTHHSEDVSFDKVMEDSFSAEGLNVVFLLGRTEAGEEALTPLTASGALPGVASKADTATCVHHHVANVQNAQSVTTMANRVSDSATLKISLNEFSAKLDALLEPQLEEMEVAPNGMVSKAAHSANKRNRLLKQARTLIVDIPAQTTPRLLDATVVRAIESKAVGTVVLSSVRSVEEVKHARDMQVHYRRMMMEQEGQRIMDARRRRLNDGGNNADGGNWNDQQDSDMSGVYYVSMTPNIFAGLLFFLLFAVTAIIGLSCMGAIQGQDVYVSKMPTVGREA
mmetsp:Transcript_10792/g.29810  ORF Transcript_10792/g.29810 Transcript_10792/m.29810 type:complete len:318 (+) Transcript_10792:58-1011(+)